MQINNYNEPDEQADSCELTSEHQQPNILTGECDLPVEQADGSEGIDAHQLDLQDESDIPPINEDHQVTSHQVNHLTTQLTNLQKEYQMRLEEIKIMKEDNASKLKGYPSMQDLNDRKIRIFYTGIPSYHVLIAIFDHAIKPLPPLHDSCKLNNFQCYTMTLMKLRLNLPNFDLACRFGIHA